jgi:formate hydrogenlyase subunit 3/multisubunit Na+/H+ antiporter MnhD subunit
MSEVSKRLPTRFQAAILFANLACLLLGIAAGFWIAKTTWFHRALRWAFPSGVTDNMHFAAAGLGLLIATVMMATVLYYMPRRRKDGNLP